MMSSRLLSFLTLLLSLLVSSSTTHAASSSYIGAVAQHAVPSPGSSPLETMLGNLATYALDTAVAAEQGAQVIVFPEFGLLANEDCGSRGVTVSYAQIVPDVNATTPLILPCDEHEIYANSPALTNGSCMAKENNIVVLINLFELVPCAGEPGCPSDGQYVFNTDVVFNETGVLVAKYRKTHPFYIFSVNPAPADQPLISFTTSFGVEFGLFICFDIMFPHPALDLVSAGVQNFLYSAAIGEIGRATMAKLWSYTNKANVLLSNHGTGASDIILQGSSATSQTLAVEGTNDTIIIATVPSA